MPELPEVESVVRGLRFALTGRSINDVRLMKKATASGSPMPLNRLKGAQIETLRRRGKYILIDCRPDKTIAIHLRMTGWLGVLEKSAWQREKDPYIRAVFCLDAAQGGQEEVLIFRDIRRFGRIWAGTHEQVLQLKALAKLGPEPFDLKPDEFAARLRARRGRLKSLLLNQSFLAGLGNIYADEALFGAGLHPLAEAHRVSGPSARRLHASIHDVLNRAISAGGSSIDDYLHPDGQPGWFQRELKVYGREGEPCVSCGKPIHRDVVGQRGTWFCPRCQKKR